MATTKKTATAVKQAQEATAEQKQLGMRIRIDRLCDDPNKKLRAVASANLPGGFAVHGIKVYENEKGFFVSMPQVSYPAHEGTTKYEDIFHPVTADARTELCSSVMSAYQQAIENAQTQSQSNSPTELTEEIPDETPSQSM